jgi:hypothetical protein
MAKEVVLQFRLRKVKEAQGLAKRIKVDVKEANQLAVKARQEQLKTRDLRAQADDKSRKLANIQKHEKRKARLKGRAARLQMSAQTFGAGEGLGRGAERFGRAAGVAAALRGGAMASVGSVGALAGGPIAAIAAVVAMVGAAVAAKLESANDRKMARLREELMTRLDEQLRLVDYNRRIEEDPVFARKEARRNFHEATDEELRMARAGLSPQADVLENF